MNRSPRIPASLRHWRPRRRPLAVTAAAAATALALSSVPAALAATPATARPPELMVVPKPVSARVSHGGFTLPRTARITVRSGGAAATAVARDLAAYLRPATGFPLPVTAGASHHGDITVETGNPPGLPGSGRAEGYLLSTGPAGVTIEAPTAHGLYNGVQTFRQLLPVWIDSTVVRHGPWTAPVTRILDWPRYHYRGLLLDIARHFESPAHVEELIAQAAAYKIDVLHLHLSDDQGFRIAINGFPRLTSVGSQGSVGTEGRLVDPGGFWTQVEYRAVVADAAAHFMTVVPEVDSPGHNNGIIMSEFGDTTNPAFHGVSPHGINCGSDKPPHWDYTEDVGYSALCPASPDTWAILSAVIGQLSAMSPGPYYDLGGDEVPTTILSAKNYAAFVSRESGIVTRHHKTVMGWADIDGPGANPPAGSVAEYWQPAGGSQPGTSSGRRAVRKHMKVVMAPANHTYLDQKYVVTARTSVPPALGMNWACPTGCDVSSAYNWDPGRFVTGVTDRNVIGVEGAMWGETVANMTNVDYMVFPRLLALSEVAWSRATHRTANSPAYRDFLTRLAAQGGRFMAAGENFYASTQVPWRLDVLGLAQNAAAGQAVPGPVAQLSAPGFPTSTLSMCDSSLGIGCTINWGDRHTTPGDVRGTNGTGTQVNSLYGIFGDHAYAKAGTYHGTVTVGASGTRTVTAGFTITVK